MLDVLCLGEALWDVMTPVGVSFARAKSVGFRAGGAAVNVAMGVAGRGGRAGVCAVVGRDALGEALRERLAEAGVWAEGVSGALDRTGVLFAERGDGGSRFVGYRGAEEPAPGLPGGWEARVVVLTGLMPGVDHARVWAEAARQARGRGARVVVDVNARPRVWRGRDAGVVMEVVGEADVVKASEEDLRVLGVDETFLRGEMRGNAVLVVTAGAGAARAMGGFGEVAREPVGVLTGDALGAGDAFTAGMVLSLLRAGALEEGAVWESALRQGHAAAGAHLKR